MFDRVNMKQDELIFEDDFFFILFYYKNVLNSCYFLSSLWINTLFHEISKRHGGKVGPSLGTPGPQDHRDVPGRPGPLWPSETPKTLSNLRDIYWDRQNDLACREAPWDHRYSSGFDA